MHSFLENNVFSVNSSPQSTLDVIIKVVSLACIPHHLMHYKKGALVLIIRKILTELPHDLPEVLIFTNANPVKRICSD